MSILRICLVMLLSLIFLSSCGDQKRKIISEEEFSEIYGDILYLGELYRTHPFELRLALDSMMESRNIDTTMINDAVNRYAQRTYDAAKLYEQVIAKLETMAREDSSRNAISSDNADVADSSGITTDTVSSTSAHNEKMLNRKFR